MMLLDLRRPLLLGLALMFACASCASTGEREGVAKMDTRNRDVSSIPWNRPEPWEGAGPLGGLGGFRGTR